MSLTSYRAAPPRAKPRWIPTGKRKACGLELGWRGSVCLQSTDLRRPGDDLLSRVLRQSTIGAEAFDGRVRDGIGSYRLAEGHQAGEDQRTISAASQRRLCRIDPDKMKQNWFSFRIAKAMQKASFEALSHCVRFLIPSDNQAERAISTGKLNALPRLHTRPINVVVFHGPSGRSGFEAGFPLRCLQRLSIPYIATLHHRWRDDRSTRGTFTPVLSY